MFDKIFFVLKDLIIYIVPGSVIMFCSILHLPNLISVNDFKESPYAMLGLAFSFIVGFLFSQMQIILFYAIRRNKNYKTIAGSSMHSDLKNRIAEQIISTFGLPDTSDIEELKIDTELLALCDNFVNIRATPESYAPVRL